MPTRNVSLTPEMDQFIASKVEAGVYANASEMMRAALRLLERDEQEFKQKMDALRTAIIVGDESEDVEGDVFEQLYAEIDDLAAEKAQRL